MELDIQEKQGVTILSIVGRIVMGADAQLREAIDTLLASGRSNVLIDFSQVTFMDSAGIGELVASHRTIKRFGGALKILSPSQKVQDSLTLTKLLPIFEIFDDKQTAVDSYADG